jgi:hypothetical protein
LSGVHVMVPQSVEGRSSVRSEAWSGSHGRQFGSVSIGEAGQAFQAEIAAAALYQLCLPLGKSAASVSYFRLITLHSGKSGYRQFGRRSEQLDPDQPQLGLEDLE